MRWFSSCIYIVALAVFPVFAGIRFDLQGRVPPGVTPEFLKSNYERIWKAVAPETAVDTSAIAIIYYSKSDERKLGVRLPEWGGGGAIGRDTVIVPIDRFALADMDIGRVTVHELVHIALERAYGPLRLPRWFHEGLAMTLSGELSFEEQVSLSRAIFAKRLMPLDSVERVNRFDRFGAALAYSQSHLAAAYMIDKYGMEGVSELLGSVRKLGGFDTALAEGFGFSPKEFDGMVRNYIVDRYRFVFFFSDSWLFWAAGALLAVAGFIAVKVRNKKRERQMEEEEKTAMANERVKLKRISLDEVLDDFGEDKN
ncbi:MAG: hypothetical protein JW699_00190 [Chitinispirillaceae bacterium]|nr:hypothetical protein [Chitinispirillaceae bacterium]